MHLVRPKNVEAALLYKDYAPFAYAEFGARLQKALGGAVQVQLGHHEDGNFGILKLEEVGTYLLISQNGGPLAQQGFEAALSSQYMDIHYPEAGAVVAKHEKNIFVTVGGEDILVTSSPELQNAIAEHLPGLLDNAVPDAQTFESYWTVAQIATHVLCTLNTPDLIHWCQSNRFIRPDEFSEATNNQSGWPFQIHPALFGSGASEHGHNKIGISIHGAEHFTGYHIIVEETIFNFERVIDEIVFEVIASLYGEGALPQSGTEITFKSGAATRVTLRPADAVHPRPYISLEVLALAERKAQKARSTPLQETEPRDHAQAQPKTAAAQLASDLPPERRSQAIEITPGGPKRMLLSPVHPNAPASAGPGGQKSVKEFAFDYGKDRKEKASRGIVGLRMVKNLAGLGMVFMLYFIVSQSGLTLGGLAPMNESGTNVVSTLPQIGATPPVQIEAETFQDQSATVQTFEVN